MGEQLHHNNRVFLETVRTGKQYHSRDGVCVMAYLKNWLKCIQGMDKPTFLFISTVINTVVGAITATYGSLQIVIVSVGIANAFVIYLGIESGNVQPAEKSQ
jgi:hypothetical protein